MLLLRGKAALDAFGSPVRVEAVEHLQRSGPASIRELAARMERPADSLYFHVRKLVGAGVLVQHGTRATGKRPEAVYALAARGLGVDPGDRSDAAREAATRSARTVLRMAERHLREAMDGGTHAGHPRRRQVLVLRQKAWLTEAGLAQLHRRLAALRSFLASTSRPGRGRLHALTLALLPIVRVTGRRFS